VLLKDMLDHARKAVAATKSKTRADLDRDEVLAAAIKRFIEVIGEAASKISDATRHPMPSIPWHEIIGMRNRLVHGYASLDRDVVLAGAQRLGLGLGRAAEGRQQARARQVGVERHG
jgi:uncharacterized protein with HEPN domain